MVEVDAIGTSGTGLGKADALDLFARVKDKRLHALHSTEETFHSMDLNGDGQISLIKFFMYVCVCVCVCVCVYGVYGVRRSCYVGPTFLCCHPATTIHPACPVPA